MFEKTANNIHRLVIEQLVKSGKSEAQLQAGIEQALKTYLNEKK